MRNFLSILLLLAAFIQAQDSLYLTFEDALNVVIAHNSDMNDVTLAVLEESQIAGARLINELDKLTHFGLLGGVTWKANADTFIRKLC